MVHAPAGMVWTTVAPASIIASQIGCAWSTNRSRCTRALVVFGSGTYDLEKNLLLKDAIGLAYDDECFTYMMTLSTKRDPNRIESEREPDERSIGFNISFRTLGDFGSATSEIVEQ